MNKNAIDKFVQDYLLDNYTNDGLKEREELNEVLLSTFMEMFGIDKLDTMSMTNYCFEKGNPNTFCYWVDNQLNDLCDIHIKRTAGFQKFHIQTVNGSPVFMRKNQKNNKFGLNPKTVFENVKKEIISVSEASQILDSKNIDIISKSHLYEPFKAKLTYMYAPNNWIPILVNDDVDNLLKYFGVSFNTTDKLTIKRCKVFEIYKNAKNQIPSLTTWRFMRFLYGSGFYRSILRPNSNSGKNALKTNNRIKTKTTQKSVYYAINKNSVTFSTATSLAFVPKTIVYDSNEISDDEIEKNNKLKKIVGTQGEIIVIDYLKSNKKNLGINNIDCPCLKGKHNLHYDISYFKNGLEHYIEVKSSRSSTNIYFEMSDGEYDFMMKNKNSGLYRIFYVYNVFANPHIVEIDPYIFCDKLLPKTYYFNN